MARPTKTWKGGWIEGVASDLALECGYDSCRTTGGDSCGCKQTDLYRSRSARVRISRSVSGRSQPAGERAVGGESSRIHDRPSPIPALPRQLTLEWFLAHGWKGSNVHREATPQGTRYTLHHPSGARLWLNPGVLQE